MQGICRLSKRWHQQFCHSPSFAPHQYCFQPLIPSRGLRQARKHIRAGRGDSQNVSIPTRPSRSATHDELSPSALLSRAGNNLLVREYEQHGSDESTLKRIKPNSELSDEVEDVWRELQDIDRELEIVREGPFGPRSEFMQQFPPEERKKILEVLNEEGITHEEEEDVLDLAEIDRLIEEERLNTDREDEFAVRLNVSEGHQALTKHFNKALKDAKEEEDAAKSLRLWKWYTRCQERIPGFSRSVPDGVWDFLWQSQSNLKVKPDHLVRLGRDILDSQVEMGFHQWLEYTEALLACTDFTEALSVWEEIESDPELRNDVALLSRFYSVGIRIHAALDRPDRGQAIAFTGIQKGADPTILVQSIIAWTKSSSSGSAAKAWSIYLKLLALMGDRMTTSIYEEISNAMLESRNSAMALAVFKDLISGIRSSGSSTLQAYEKAIGKICENGDAQEVEDAINQVSLTMLLTLPKEYQNKYFFASWIKKLIGENRVEAAAMVADLMYERGIKPDAIHLNGLLGAWFRDNSQQACERAEKLAKQMIQAKVDQVATLSNLQDLQDLQNLFRKVYVSDDTRVPQPSVQESRSVPTANQETFSLMFDYYERKRRWADFESLTKTLIGPAQLRPNTFIMNKLLAVELQNGSLDRFWAIHKGLHERVGPNIETYGLAWQATGLEAQKARNFAQSKHRQQFANLMDWMSTAPARVRKAALGDFDDSFYGQITKSFCYRLDLAGVICAVQGLYTAFGHAPPDFAIQLILGSAARALPRVETRQMAGSRRRRGPSQSGVDQTKLNKIAEIIDTIEADMKLQHTEQYNIEPGKLEDRTSTEFKRLRVDVVTRFLVLMMQNISRESPNTVRKTLTDVARSMHVDIGDINTDME